MLRFVQVTEGSLSPEYQPGDYVLISRLSYVLRPPRRGDVVVFRHPDYGTLIKRVESVAADGSELTVAGTHDWSVDSRRFGPIRREAVVGKVIWHVKKPRAA